MSARTILEAHDDAWNFEELLLLITRRGEKRTDRTGTGTLSIFSPPQLRYSLESDSVPLITSKAVPWKMATRELMWMLSGSTNTNDLREKSPQMANLWDSWANPQGDIGPTYGAQYRNAGGSLNDYGHGVDQLRKVLVQLAETPDTRRALISLWSVAELQDMALEPCMVLFQFSLRGDSYDQLHIHVYQRSADMMLGVPFDLYQGGLLTHLIARELTKQTGKYIRATELTWSAGDAHIYTNQLEAAKLQLGQWSGMEPMRATVAIDPFPSLRLLDGTLEAGHIRVQNYNPQPAIDAGTPAV